MEQQVKNPPAKTNGAVEKTNPIRAFFSQENVKAKFIELLGKRANGFITSVIQAAMSNKYLKEATPESVYGAAAIAATLDLPINNALGFAAIVPYRDGKQGGKHVAQFQIQWKGLVQLGMRTGQYQTMNVAEVYEGELVEHNRFTGTMTLDAKKRKSDKVVGFVAYFKLINGFEKYLYMTMDEVLKHGRKYSKAFETGLWAEVKNGNYAMPLKTVAKQLLSKYGIMSIDIQRAIVADQGVSTTGNPDDVEYVDNETHEIDATVMSSEIKEAVTKTEAAMNKDKVIPKNDLDKIEHAFSVADSLEGINAVANSWSEYRGYGAFESMFAKAKKKFDKKK